MKKTLTLNDLHDLSVNALDKTMDEYKFTEGMKIVFTQSFIFHVREELKLKLKKK